MSELSKPLTPQALGLLLGNAALKRLTANASSNTRDTSALFPGWFDGNKRNHYTDFGWPASLTTTLLQDAYRRNGIASAAVDKTAAKTWQNLPEIHETDKPDETKIEKAIRERFEDIRLWQSFIEADIRSMVCGYSAVIFRYADGLKFDQPVGVVSGGIDGLVEVIPAWATELGPIEFEANPEAENYGRPTMYEYKEAPLVNSAGISITAGRQFKVHPDRVLIWSRDGTIHARSLLGSGFNSLIDMEKVRGSSGEGFWKNAKAAPILTMDENATAAELASAMNVPVADLADELDEQISLFQRGLDAALLLHRMTVSTLSVTLPSPEHFHNIMLQTFAASVGIPLKILVGSQTGERASTEDAREWNAFNQSRRLLTVLPLIRDFLNRLERARIIAERDWKIEWPDLTESTTEDKLAVVEKMAGINKSQASDPVFTVDELREVADYEPLPEGSFDHIDQGLDAEPGGTPPSDPSKPQPGGKNAPASPR